MNLLPGTLAHEDAKPPDSRGLYADPYAEPKPAALSLLHIAGGYLAAPDAPSAPCYVCGEERPVVMTLIEPPYAICPAREKDECLERKLAANRAGRAETAAETAGTAGAPEEAPAAAEDTGKRPRLSRARRAVLDEASKTAAELAADNAPASSAEQDQDLGGDAA